MPVFVQIIAIITVILMAYVIALFIFAVVRFVMHLRLIDKMLQLLANDIEILRRATGYNEKLVNKIRRSEDETDYQLMYDGQVICSHCGFINKQKTTKCSCCKKVI